MILVNSETKEIHTAVGQAVDAYAGVEGAQAQMMEALLKLSPREASIIFYSVQNVRSRHEMIQELLKLRHKDKYKKFWSACWKFLRKLAIFRNALVHWHPILVVYLDESGQNTDDDHDHALGPPMGGDFEDVKASDIPPFLKDCHYIEQEIHALRRDLLGEPPERALPDRFLKPNLRQNLAVLRVHRNREAQQVQ